MRQCKLVSLLLGDKDSDGCQPPPNSCPRNPYPQPDLTPALTQLPQLSVCLYKNNSPASEEQPPSSTKLQTTIQDPSNKHQLHALQTSSTPAPQASTSTAPDPLYCHADTRTRPLGPAPRVDLPIKHRLKETTTRAAPATAAPATTRAGSWRGVRKHSCPAKQRLHCRPWGHTTSQHAMQVCCSKAPKPPS